MKICKLRLFHLAKYILNTFFYVFNMYIKYILKKIYLKYIKKIYLIYILKNAIYI